MKRVWPILAIVGFCGLANAGDVINVPGSQVATTLSEDSSDYDDLSGARMAVDFEHHEVHEGEHFFVEGSSVMASGAIIDFCVQTPDTATYAHMLFDFASTFSLDVRAYESSTWTWCGNAVTPYNSNRNATGASAMTVYKSTGTTGTGVTAGTLLVDKRIGYSTGPTQRAGGTLRRENEIILKRNTKYLFRLTSNTADNRVGYSGNWYEHQQQ